MAVLRRDWFGEYFFSTEVLSDRKLKSMTRKYASRTYRIMRGLLFNENSEEIHAELLRNSKRRIKQKYEWDSLVLERWARR